MMILKLACVHVVSGLLDMRIHQTFKAPVRCVENLQLSGSRWLWSGVARRGEFALLERGRAAFSPFALAFARAGAGVEWSGVSWGIRFA